MNRRRLLQLGLCAAVPTVAYAQQRTVIGYLSSTGLDEFRHSSFRRGLERQGYAEGRDFVIEFRWAEGRYERLPALVGELSRIPSSIMFAGGNQAALAVKSAGLATPVVFTIGDDPVQLGLVASLNRPGGKMTGTTFYSFALAGKRLEILHELVPPDAAVAMIWSPNSPSIDAQRREVQDAAIRLRRKIEFFAAGNSQELDAALNAIVERKIGGVFYGTDPFFNSERRRLAEFAIRQRMPLVFSGREYINDGGLISYGASVNESYVQAGDYVGRILRGENPADLPVMQPTKFELLLNLKAAKAAGMDFPQKILALADDVIE